MKKLFAVAVAAVCAATSSMSLHATADTSTEFKKATTFSATTIAGTIIGGPLGMLAGAFAGAYLGETIETASEVDSLEKQVSAQTLALEAADLDLQELSYRLADSEGAFAELNRLTQNTLTLPVLFSFGSDQLNPAGQQHIAALSEFLQQYPNYQVHLEGHTDGLGDNRFNQHLSKARTESIVDSLAHYGINRDRISFSAQGANEATASKADQPGRAKERRVEIELIPVSPSVVMN